jgi:predicted phosphodiesterase
MEESLVFLLNSDTHYNKNGIRPDKLHDVDKMLEIVSSEKVDAVIVPGDLTDNGANGVGSCWAAKTSCGTPWCELRNEYDQLGAFDSQLLKKLEKHVDVYLSHGNHDTYWSSIDAVLKKFFGISNFQFPVLNFISKKHGSIRYSFYKKNVHFICLGMYPDRDGMTFLKGTITADAPTIIFFHFSLDSEPEWWPINEKEEFYKYISGVSNLLCVCAGHHHETHDKIVNGVRFLNGAGPNSFLRCEYSGGKLTTTVIYSN